MSKQLATLKFALGMEIEGKAFFAKAADSTKNADARHVFLDLVRMEEGHIAYIQGNIDALNRENKWMIEPASGELGEIKSKESVFEARGKGKGPEPELAIGVDTSDMSALRIALAIENDLHSFYKKAGEYAKEADAKTVFEKLAGWEKRHRELLESQYEEMKKSFWSDMGFSPF
jgi:rubrerythrin